MRRPKVVPLKPKTIGRPPRGFTYRDIAFLSHVASQSADDPVKPRKGEKGAAERLRRAGYLYRRQGAESDGYLISSDGERVLEQLVSALELATRAQS